MSDEMACSSGASINFFVTPIDALSASILISDESESIFLRLPMPEQVKIKIRARFDISSGVTICGFGSVIFDSCFGMCFFGLGGAGGPAAFRPVGPYFCRIVAHAFKAGL